MRVSITSFIILVILLFLNSPVVHCQASSNFVLNNEFDIQYAEMSQKLKLSVTVLSQEIYPDGIYKNGYFFTGVLKKKYILTSGTKIDEFQIAGICYSNYVEFGERNSYYNAKNDNRNTIFKKTYFSGNWDNTKNTYCGKWTLPGGGFDIQENACLVNPICIPEIKFSHQKKNEFWPFDERTLEISLIFIKNIKIKSNTILWRTVKFSGVNKNELICPPHGEIDLLALGSQIDCSYSTSTGAAALLNSVDILLSFYKGKRLPTNVIETEKELINAILDGKFGQNVLSTIANLGFEFSNLCSVIGNDSYNDGEKINAISSFVKKVVESARNKTFYEILSKLCDAAGIKLSPEILKNILDQINIIKKGIDLATYAWDIRRTPTYETVSIKLCK